MRSSKILLAAVIAGAIVAFFAFDLGRFFTLESIKSYHAQAVSWYQANPWLVLIGFFMVYVAVTGLSLPGAALMTLLAGAVFGLATGLVLVSFASTIGATLAFLTSRFILRDSVQRKFGNKLKAINRGIEREGALYLFALRLVPAFPFFVINLVMGLTPLKTWTFYWVSQLGMLAGTAVYVNAGTQLAQIERLGDIVSPGLIGAFVLLGLFPLLAKWLVRMLESRKVYKGWDKPKRFDRNLVVVGAGSGGLVSAYIAATVKAEVSLVEKHRMGGDCLNTGCVPSKALIRSAKLAQQMRTAEQYGLGKHEPEVDFAQVMQRVHSVIEKIEPHDSVERYTGLGVDVIEGSATIRSPWSVDIQRNDGSQQTLNTRNIIIATGARPFVPPIPGIEDIEVLTSDNLWSLTQQPKRLVVLGGGPIGCELSQAFARLGSEVTQVEMMERLMVREDPEVSEFVEQRFRAEGVRVLTGHKAQQINASQDGPHTLVCEHQGKTIEVEFDQLLCAVGRKANVEGFGLEALNIATRKNGTIETDDFLATQYPNIYAVGDVTGPYQFTHMAAHQAWFAAVNALFGRFKRFKVDYSVVPWVTFTDPEVARVGLNEQDAAEYGIDVEVTRYGIDDLDRAIAESADEGFVKVLTEPGKDKILGATIVGEHAGELLTEFVTAMKRGLGMNKLLGTIHVYPTLSEANKFAAGEWKKARKPEGLLNWVQRFHRRQLG
jgi:dihydrolipoamide dehydrogenase